MLIEYTKPRSITIGSLALIPGVNKVDDKVWASIVDSKKWKSPIAGLVSSGKLILIDAKEKVTIELVDKTYDASLLEDWLEKAKGPLKGAIRKQLKALEIEESA